MWCVKLVTNCLSDERPWLKKGIVVKVVTKSLGEKYYKQKGFVKEVVGDDRMGAVVQMINSGSKVNSQPFLYVLRL